MKFEPLQPFTVFPKQSNPSSIYLQDSTPDEIRRTINGLENNKASDIPIKIIKRSAHIISPILSKYINQSMTRGIFPDRLKIGKITLIYKKDDKELFENYRPVFTLPIFGKIFEKVIYERLYRFFYISAVDDSKPIWLPKRSLNQPCFKLFHKPHPGSPEKKSTCSRNIYRS